MFSIRTKAERAMDRANEALREALELADPRPTVRQQARICACGKVAEKARRAVHIERAKGR